MAPGDLDVRVISMHTEVPPAIRRVFPTAMVIAATDLRAASPRVLHTQGVITDDALESIEQGRRYHRELSSCGGVGLWYSVCGALAQGSRPLLLFEEDCVPSPQLPLAVQRLLDLAPDAEGAFDLAVFGPLRTDGFLVSEAPAHRGFGWCDGYFWGMHAVLYTADGRARARAMLRGPVDAQLDAKVAWLALYGQPVRRRPRLRVLLQCPGEPLARQLSHPSSLQSDSPAPLGALGALGDLGARAWTATLRVLRGDGGRLPG